jgi:hypothetical protein
MVAMAKFKNVAKVKTSQLWLFLHTGHQTPCCFIQEINCQQNIKMVHLFVSMAHGTAPLKQGGYFVAFVPFGKNGKPSGEYEVFAEGFAGGSEIKNPNEAKARPMGLARSDGSLYISDSVKGKVWRVIKTKHHLMFKYIITVCCLGGMLVRTVSARYSQKPTFL